MLTKFAKELLTAAGWAGRGLLSRQEYESTYKRYGFDIVPSALNFLETFGGIKAYIKNTAGDERKLFDFDVGCVLDLTDQEDIDDYSYQLGVKICPVGRCDWDHCIVAVAQDGKVYAYFDPSVSLIGRSSDEAINNICSGHSIEIAKFHSGKLHLE